MLVTAGAPRRRTAVSSSVATPEPLSLMPGPVGTESRCAPTITTLSGLPVVVWAITLRLRRSSIVVASTRVTEAPARPARASPSALLSPAVGRVPGTSPRVPWSSGPSTLFATSTAAARAAAALADFTPNGHVPRRISTIAPAGTPVKSAASQPDVSSCASTASGAVAPPGGVAGEKPSAVAAMVALSTVRRRSCTENERALNSGVSTV